MATLSKHGTEIGRLVYVDYVKSYRSDGTVLKNHGFGWKMAGKVKPGADIVDVYQKAVEHQRDFLAKYPAHAAYRKMLHSLAGVGTGGFSRYYFTLQPYRQPFSFLH